MTEKNGGYGRYTHADLRRTQALCAPRAQFMGAARPEFSVTAARLSLELAATAYHLNLGEWMNAGWTDISVQVDTKLVGGLAAVQAGASAPRQVGQMLKNTWKLHRARAEMRQLNPVQQVRSYLREHRESDTAKAVVMLRRAPEGKCVVAIGFMGTGSRFYDWFSNFRLGYEEGMHRGFLQLTRQFEDNEREIEFPQTARALGVARLTLRDILEECKRPDSRFTLWLSGHSQGAAVMQLWTHRRMAEGVLPEHIVGYGFAAPTVADALWPGGYARYPLYLIQNSDDLVTRVGGAAHLGICLYYPADEDFRRQCYGASGMGELLPLLGEIKDTGDALIYLAALMEALAGLPEEELAALLHLPALLNEALLQAVGGKMRRLPDYARRRLLAAYEQVTGEAPPPERLLAVYRRLSGEIARTGALAFMRRLTGTMLAAHHLARSNGMSNAAYTYIVRRGAQRLRSAAWVPGAPPRLRPVGGGFALPAQEAQRLQRVRSRAPARRVPPQRHGRYSAQRHNRAARASQTFRLKDSRS